MREILFKLLRCSLWGKPFGESIDGADFIRILPIAEQQTVLGMVIGALKDTRVEGVVDKTPLL